MLILVLEASTTSAKAMLYDGERGILKVDSRSYPPTINDVATQDTEGVYRELLKIGRDVCSGHQADAVALSSTWHNIAILDKDMRPITRTHSWTDTSAADLVARLRSDKDFTLSYYHTTGCMVHTTYAPFKLIHMREQGLNLRNTYIVDQGSYNFFRLTGEKICTTSMASGLGLLNIHDLDYEPFVLDLIGISSGQLGCLRKDGAYGRLMAGPAAELGLKPGVPVIAAYPDGALNQVGAGAMKSGIMTLSVGTSAAMRLIVPRPVIPQTPSTWCYFSAAEDWLSGAATAGSCNCLDWIKNHVFEDQFTYRMLEDPGVDMENLPIFLPFLFGERCLGWNDTRMGGYQNLKPSHNAKDLFVSAMEGVLFNIKQCYDALTLLSGDPGEIKVSGGVLRSPMWSQMLSDILGKPITCSDMEQASLLGGAIVGMAVIDSGRGIDLPLNIDTMRIIEPDAEASALYSRRYQRYLHWYQKG